MRRKRNIYPKNIIKETPVIIIVADLFIFLRECFSQNVFWFIVIGSAHFKWKSYYGNW